jgi:hypothetical protein
MNIHTPWLFEEDKSRMRSASIVTIVAGMLMLAIAFIGSGCSPSKQMADHAHDLKSGLVMLRAVTQPAPVAVVMSGSASPIMTVTATREAAIAGLWSGVIDHASEIDRLGHTGN